MAIPVYEYTGPFDIPGGYHVGIVVTPNGIETITISISLDFSGAFQVGACYIVINGQLVAYTARTVFDPPGGYGPATTPDFPGPTIWYVTKSGSHWNVVITLFRSVMAAP